jgi:hypothetical protein
MGALRLESGDALLSESGQRIEAHGGPMAQS